MEWLDAFLENTIVTNTLAASVKNKRLKEQNK
jgi:hypothetical protein